MKKFAQANQIMKVSGPLKNSAGGRAFVVYSNKPIPIAQLILKREYGNGFNLGGSTAGSIPVGEEAGYPKLLAEVLTLDGKQPSPRFQIKGDFGTGSPGTQPKPYINIYNALVDKTAQNQLKYSLYPGEWLRILSPEETQKALQLGYGGGEEGQDNKKTNSNVSGLAKYRYVDRQIIPIDKQRFNPSIPIVDKSGKIINQSSIGELPSEMYVYMIEGKLYQSVAPAVSYKDTELIVPRDQFNKIESALATLTNPSSSEDAKNKSVQIILDQGGLDYIKAFGPKIGVSTVIRDATKIFSLLTGNTSTLPADTIQRFMSVMGINDPTQRKITLTNPKPVSMTIPGLIPGMESQTITVNEFVDKDGKKYYSQNMQSSTLTITKNTIGMPIAQALSLSMALSTLTNAKTPEQKQQAMLGIIDSVPGVANELGLGGYSFSDLYHRITQFDPTLSSTLKPEAINKMMSDPLIQKFMQKLSVNSAKFGAIPVNKQFEIILLIRDGFSGNASPLQLAASLQQTIKDLPGAADIFPSINGQPLLDVAEAMTQLLGFDPTKASHSAVDPKTIVTISRVLGLNESDLSKLKPGQLTNLMSIVFSIQSSMSDPKKLQEVVAYASNELPKMLPGVPNEIILRGILRISQIKDPLVLVRSYLSNKSLVKAAEVLTGTQILDANGNILLGKIDTNQLLSLFSNLSDIENGRIVPLAALSILSDQGILPNIKLGDANVINMANSLAKLLGSDIQIDNANLVNLLKAVNIDASSLANLNPNKLPSLAEIVSGFGSGDAQAQQEAISRFQIEILPELQLGKDTQNAFKTISEKLKAGVKIDDIKEVQDLLKSDPRFKELLVQVGLLSPESDPLAKQILNLKGNITYTYDPSKSSYALEDQKAEVVGVVNNTTVIVRIYDLQGNPLEDVRMTVEEAQNSGIPVSSNPSIRQELVSGNQSQINVSKADIFHAMSPGEVLAVASAARQLLDGRIDLFKFACLLQSMPTIKQKLGASANYLKALGAVNNALRAMKNGGLIDFESLSTLSKDLGLKLDSRTQVELKQAVALSSAFKAYQKGDYATTLYNLANAFPETNYSNLAAKLATNLVRLQKGNPVEILRIFENNKDIVRILQKLHILGPKELSLYLKSKNGQINYSDALMAGSTVMDLINGRVDPLVAAKRLLAIPGLEGFLGGHGKTLAIATDLYEEALKFGHAPVDPAAIDASIKKLSELTHSNIGKLGLPGVNGLSYGQAVAIVNSLTLALNGKWQLALQQITFLIPLPGGWSVGIIFQILFLFFPGLANLFGKGGSSDKPNQNCNHCGCKVRDPGGSDNNRDYKPGGLLCKHCGCEIRSKKEPDSIPGSPSLLDPACNDYPWNPGARATCGPHYRTGLATDCTYYKGKWNTEKDINNHDCVSQLKELGATDVTSGNINSLSLYCRDEFAYYGTLSGDWRSSETGKQKDLQYQTDKSTRSMKESEYNLKINKAIEDEFKKSPFYGPFVQHFKNIDLPSGNTQFDIYTIVLQMYADLIRNTGNKVTLEQTCQFMVPSGALEMGLEDVSRYGKDESCDQWVKKLNYYWTQLPPIPLRDYIFDMFKIKKDYLRLRKSMGEAAMSTTQR